MSNKLLSVYLFFILLIILTACQPPPTAPEPIIETLVVTEVVEATPVEVIQVVTPTPEPGGRRTLVICVGFEPSSLYRYNSPFTPIEAAIMEAIADGQWSAFDNNSFAYQPVLLEKLPSLADGDAALKTVIVKEGDKVVDAVGRVVVLEANADPVIMLVPAGGGAAFPYKGGEFEIDQLSVIFTLLPDLLWSDGQPITAADSVYAFNLLADPDTPQTNLKIERTGSYESDDELTTVWTGLPGFLDAEYYRNFFGPAPEHIWGQYSAAELLEAEVSHLKPVGWGPYVIDEWVPGESITLHKNPNYFRAAEGLPKFDHLIYRFIGQNANASVAALLSGECDILDPNTGVAEQSQLILDLQNSGQINATFTTGTAWEHVDFGIQHVDYDDGYQIGVERPDFFSDVRTRQAFALCMDRQNVIDSLLFGLSPVIDTYLPPQHPLYNPDVRHYDFDVAAGSRLLEEVGWLDDDSDPDTPRVAQGASNVPDGTPMEIYYETSATGIRPQVAAILKNSLSQCGIKANIQTYPVSEWFADGPEGKLFGRQYDLGEFLWLTGVAPACDLFLTSQFPGPAGEDWVSIQDGRLRTISEAGWGGNNITGFTNEAYDSACSKALSSLPGQPEYEESHLEAQRIFADQLPVVPLYLFTKIAATRPDMCGFIMDPTNSSAFWNIEEFDYGEGCEE